MGVKALRAGYIDHIPTTVADGYPLLDKVFEKVANHAKVVEWFRIQHNTPKLKLTYFDFPGAAEPIRLAFHLGGIAFEDERISWDEFLQRKPALPFVQLPVLRVDDDEISQSFAILRYVGGLSGLYPSADVLAAFQIDEIFCAIEELRGNIGPSYHEKDDEKKLAMRKVLADETIPKVLGQLEKRVAANNQSGGSFAVGATLTVADLVIASQLDAFTDGRLDGVPTTVVDPFPALLKIREQVKAHPKVAEWNAAHA